MLVNNADQLCLVGSCLVVMSRTSCSGRVRVFSGGGFGCVADVTPGNRNPGRVAIVKGVKIGRRGKRFCMSSRKGLGVCDCGLSDILASSLCGPRIGAQVGTSRFPSHCRCVGSALYVNLVVMPVKMGSCAPRMTG